MLPKGVLSQAGAKPGAWCWGVASSPSPQHPWGCGPEAACLRMAFPSCHLQNPSLRERCQAERRC